MKHKNKSSIGVCNPSEKCAQTQLCETLISFAVEIHFEGFCMENGERLVLFEGIILGIYGNWLISLVERISYKPFAVLGPLADWYQPYCLLASFGCLSLLVALGVFQPKYLSRWLVALTAVGHVSANYAVLYVEGVNLENAVFFLIGAVLFFLIYLVELVRIKESPHIHVANAQFE
jgi:hypothetical protein